MLCQLLKSLSTKLSWCHPSVSLCDGLTVSRFHNRTFPNHNVRFLLLSEMTTPGGPPSVHHEMPLAKEQLEGKVRLWHPSFLGHIKKEHCLDACISALDSGSTCIGVSLPTGSGKTTVFISLLACLAPPVTNLEATKYTSQ